MLIDLSLPVLCCLLIFLIFFQLPKDTVGLTTLGTNFDALGSQMLADKIIKGLTLIAIIIYIVYAYILDIR